MKRQIILIITILMLACSWGFVAAQSTKTTSLTDYMSKSTKPIWLKQWLIDMSKTSTITSYSNPKKILEWGNIFAEQYLVAMWREMDVMYQTIWTYRKWLIDTQAKLVPWGSSSDCNGLTDLDVVALMSKSSSFVDRIGMYPTLKIEQFDPVVLDNACRKRVSCMGGDARVKYNSLTAAQAKWPICSERITSQVLALYDVQIGMFNFDLINQYNNIFIDGSGDNAPFELGQDIRTIVEHHVDHLVKPVDSTKTNKLDIVKSAPVSWLPDELIASTQQLLTALELDNTVDPRQDAQIASLIGQLTTVSSSTATIPTGSILNACIDPTTAQQNVDTILKQLQQTQQATQQYNASLNTDQQLNNAINGSLDPASLTSQPVRLWATTVLDRTIETIETPASLADNAWWNDIASINNADLPPAWPAWTRLSWDVSAVLSATGGVDPMKQCASSCVQKYSKENSSCIQDCKDKWQIWWVLNMRACRQQCFNAKIACSAACFCQYKGSTTPTSGEVAKIHDAFEVRWCLVPTNKLRNPVDSSCMRTDPDTGVFKWPSIECLLDKTIEQWVYNRESGQWWLRIKPRERFELPNKFDLKKMIRFTVWVTNKPISDNRAKKKDIDESKAKQDYAREAQKDPSLLNSQVAWQTQENLADFIDYQIKLWNDIADQAKAIQWIVSQQ
jgi:hypothetical protein